MPHCDHVTEPITERTGTTGSGPAFRAPDVRDRGTGTAPPDANTPMHVPDLFVQNVR